MSSAAPIPDGPTGQAAGEANAPWRRRRWVLAAAVVTVVALVFSVGVLVLGGGSKASGSGERAVLVVGDRHYELQLATTQAQQRRGLGYRARMPVESGMLFVYSTTSSQRCFWMDGMRFALDMVWLSRTDKVVSVRQDISATSPFIYCATSQDVVELDAGQAAAAGIEVGQELKLEMPGP